MNKIFKVIWNPATGSYSVASETAKSRGKKSGRSKLLISALVAGGMFSSFGALANAGNDNGQGVDYGSGSAGDGWVAIGKGAKANTFMNTSGSSTAVGYEAIAEGQYSSAIGSRTHAIGGASMAFGVSAISEGDRSIALGASSYSLGQYSMALGRYSKALGKLSIAMGDSSKAEGANAIALGNATKATEIMSIALGDTANASKAYSMALGASSVASAENAIALGRSSVASGTDSLALGRQTLASAANAIAIGAESKAAENATAVGTKAEANGLNSIALGSGGIADADNTIALGNQSLAVAAGAIAIGQGNKADGANAIALGNGSVTGGANAIALGQGSYAGLENGIAIGGQASAQGTNSVALGAGSVATEDNSVSVGNTTDQRKIVNMAAGDISTSSTDAINGSQLYAISKSVADRLGGGATVNAQGVVTAPNYRLKNGIYGNVGDALADLNNNTIQWDSVKKGYSAAHGTDATSTLTNVKAGTISATSTDAVNGSQLKATNDDVEANTANIATNTSNIATNTASIATNTTNITNLTDSVGDLKDDALLWNDAKNAFSAAHDKDTTSKITNVKDGDLTAGSTDAVNGSQLKTTNDAVATNTTNIANNTSNIATNTTNISNLTETVTNLGEDALKWDKDSGVFTAAHGTEATSKITNVKDADLTADSTDAVNGSQLKTTNDAVATNTTNIATNTTNISNLTETVTNLGEDALKWDKDNGVFTAAHGNNTASKITNILDGTVTATSSDAINGSQLYDLSSNIASYFGGNASVNTDGVFTGPTYKIGETNYYNVGDALAAINSSFSTSLGDALLWDTSVEKFSAKHGTNGDASVITDVANGDVSSTSSDAVNGSQLYTTNKYVVDVLGGSAEVNADGSISAPTYTIANTDYDNVGDALDALDDNALLWDETANGGAGAYNASHDGKASIITNVANGSISEDSTDAVNGSQLNATNMMIEQNSQIINQLAGNTDATYIEENGAGINYVRTNDNGLAFNDASASGVGATAVGYNAVASGASSVAIGQNSSSTVDTGIALGSSSVSSRVIAKGSRDTSVSEEGVVIGYDTTDGELLGALSIGDDGKYRQIINVADGSEAHDAVTVRQLQNAIGAVATTPTKYYHANSTAEDSLAVGEDSLAMGAKTVVNGNAGIGIGLNTLVLADAINGIAIGSNARANHANSIAMGNGSQTTRGAQTGYTAYNMDAPQNSVGEFSVGSEDGQRQITNVAAGSADTDAVNVGQLKVTDERVTQNTQSITNLNNQVTNLDTRVTNIENGIGDIVTTGSTKYFKTNTDGVDANAQGKDSVAIGSGSIAAADNSVALGTGSVANEENTISVGSSTNQRRITNVAAGVNATDAVNVSQLKSSEAGGVRYDTKADGSIDYSNITLGGGNGSTTRISNVSAGVNNNDAVNYAQLKQSVQETKQYTDQRMVEMDNKLSKTESKLSGGIASAMAMTGLPQAYTPGASMASIGGGTYNGESAVALGVSMVSANGRWVYKLQGSTNSQGEYSAALGAGIQW
ncbi:TPA: YadA-like family protein [Escherichia coli]|uniref:YadA-like family protein n=1 Tax=Escherichia coli TaxID=562 RepID=UPI001CC167C3|nr:YadA-like family protein [Escherichia coli]HDP4876230.1 YadA-like family protein [Escherichia coli]HDP4887842.1 YadA-like family protein [Escherichia coli]HDP4890113.1 YadA-like family protein [Escherichia coli]HDP4894665.1 YadA-like family protein [Escherichia coli]HDP4898951.1 YadA-like family protein [Escherichia coli]